MVCPTDGYNTLGFVLGFSFVACLATTREMGIAFAETGEN